MRKLLAVTVGVAASFVLGAAAPKDAAVWSCWHSISGDKEGASYVVLVQGSDGVLRVKDSEFIEYKVLQDNEVGLVAVRGYAQNLDKTKELGADVVVIDKARQTFSKTNVGGPKDDVPRMGKCELR